MTRPALEDAANDVAVGLNTIHSAADEPSRVDAGDSLHISRSDEHIGGRHLSLEIDMLCNLRSRMSRAMLHAHLDSPPVRVVNGDSAICAFHERQQASRRGIAGDDPPARARALSVASVSPDTESRCQHPASVVNMICCDSECLCQIENPNTRRTDEQGSSGEQCSAWVAVGQVVHVRADLKPREQVSAHGCASARSLASCTPVSSCLNTWLVAALPAARAGVIYTSTFILRQVHGCSELRAHHEAVVRCDAPEQRLHGVAVACG